MAKRKCSPRVVLKNLTINVVLLLVFVIVYIELGVHVVHRHNSPDTALGRRTVDESQYSTVNRTNTQHRQSYGKRLRHMVANAGTLPEEEELEDFLNIYREYCNQTFTYLENSTQCPCIPARLGKF